MADTDGPWRRQPPQPSSPGAGARGGRLGLWLLLVAGLGGVVVALARAFPEALQTGDDWASLAYRVGLLLVVAAWLFRAGRGAFARHLRHMAIWFAVAAVLALGFAYREDFAGVGRRLRLAFSAGDPVTVADHELVIPQDERGAFVVVGKVNGQRVRFVVDTGASETVLSPDDARRAGVDIDKLSYVYAAETANGLGYGAAYQARRLEVGPIAFDGFPMAVNKAPMSASLLGLSFLDRLESFEVRGRMLILKWRDGQGPSGAGF